MMNLNRVDLVGCLARDIELRKTQTGKSVTNFTIAINEGYGENKITQFIDCVAWEKRAEYITQYAVKGTRVCVSGRLSCKTSQDEHGNWKKDTKVIADQISIETVDKADRQPQRAESTQHRYSMNDNLVPQETRQIEPTEAYPSISAEDLPF